MRLQFRHLFPVFLLLCLLLSSIAYAQQRGVKRVESYATADRHALVIGNSEYEQVGRLRNPVNDADAMTRTLDGLGFKVTTLKNADLRTMERTITAFGKKLRVGGADGTSSQEAPAAVPFFPLTLRAPDPQGRSAVVPVCLPAAGVKEGGLTVPIAQSTILHDGVAETSPQQHSPLQADPLQRCSVQLCISQAGFL